MVRKRLSCRDSLVVNGTILGQRSCLSLAHSSRTCATARPQLAKADTAFQGGSVGQPTEPCLVPPSSRSRRTATPRPGFFELERIRAMVLPVPESRASACSKPRRRDGRLPCGLPSPALSPPAQMRRRWSRVTWCPWDERMRPAAMGQARRYILRWMALCLPAMADQAAAPRERVLSNFPPTRKIGLEPSIVAPRGSRGSSNSPRRREKLGLSHRPTSRFQLSCRHDKPELVFCSTARLPPVVLPRHRRQ